MLLFHTAVEQTRDAERRRDLASGRADFMGNIGEAPNRLEHFGTHSKVVRRGSTY
jgi:hypothetical protein